MKGKHKNRSERGATLFTVILLGVILAAIGASTFLVSSQLSNRTVQERGVTAAFQTADSAAEYVRNEYIRDKRISGLSSTDWLNQITATTGATRAVASLNNSDGNDAGLTPAAANVKTNTANLISLDARFANTYRSASGNALQVRARVYSSNPAGTFTVKVTAVLPDGSEQTVVKGFTSSDLAAKPPAFGILTRNINCAFCHVKINGDTGALSIVRPGWTFKSSIVDVGYNESTGAQSGSGDGAINSLNAARGDTSIKGSLFGLQKFTNDTSSNGTQPNASGTIKNLNGVAITDPDGGVATVTERYDGSKFDAVKAAGDLDGDGIKNDIPPVDLTKAQQASTGTSITVTGTALSTPDLYAKKDLAEPGLGGAMYRIPPGDTYSSNLQAKITLTDAEKTGTLILIGTKDNPISLPSDFYFDGDIILKGYVSGQGNVTASRNVYIAGEVLYKSPPGTGGSGNYNDKTTAQANILAQTEATTKDSLRVYAGGNAIVGDYTNQKDSVTSYTDSSNTSLLNPAFREPESFIRQQFGLDQPAANVQNTYKIPLSLRYFNKANGEELTCVKDSTGLCVSYKSITGSTVSSSNVVSKDAPDAYDYIVKPGSIQTSGSTVSFKKSITDKQFRDILGVQDMTDKATVRAASSYKNASNVVDISATNATKSDVPSVLYNDSANNTAQKKADAVNNKIANQIERIDGYIYANRRIAGVVRGSSLVSNGGFVTKEFGLLAAAVESSKNGQTAPANCTTPNATLTGKPNNYCTGLDYGTDKNSNDANTNGTGLQINYDQRLNYITGAPLGSVPVGSITFFRLGTSVDRTF